MLVGVIAVFWFHSSPFLQTVKRLLLSTLASACMNAWMPYQEWCRLVCIQPEEIDSRAGSADWGINRKRKDQEESSLRIQYVFVAWVGGKVIDVGAAQQPNAVSSVLNCMTLPMKLLISHLWQTAGAMTSWAWIIWWKQKSCACAVSLL